MRTLCVITALVVSISTFALADEDSMPQVADTQNSFALDLYAKLRTTPGNLFFSPYSIATAISMTRDGARAATADQIDKTLHFTGGTAQSDAQIAALMKVLNAGGSQDRPMYKLVTANAMWLQNDYPILPDYTARIRSAFSGDIQNVDFKSAPDQSRSTINKWVADKTSDKIKELVPASAIQPSTRFVLTNAIYFKAPWQNEFKPSETADAPFHAPGGDVTVSMMNRRMATGYFENDQFQMVSLQYRGNSLDMVLILPKKNDGLADLESKLTIGDMVIWLSSLKRAEVTLGMPKLKLATTLQLSRTLISMGMPDAFDADKADFSGISDKEKISIGDVIHQATLDVDEKGTEAAAATAVVMLGAARMKLDEKTFTADRPFLLIIRSEQANSILFMGRCEKPEK